MIIHYYDHLCADGHKGTSLRGMYSRGMVCCDYDHPRVYGYACKSFGIIMYLSDINSLVFPNDAGIISFR